MINGVDIRWSKRGNGNWNVIVRKDYGPHEYKAEVVVVEPFDDPHKFVAAERAALQSLETQMTNEGILG